MTTDQLNNLTNATSLLRSLVEMLIDYPRALEITPHHIPDAHGKIWRVDWDVVADINDVGKVIGKAGAHVKALKRVMEMAGEVNSQRYVVKVLDGKGERQPEIVREPAAVGYSPEFHHELLADVLLATGVDAEVMVRTSPGTGTGFVFILRPRNHASADLLNESPSTFQPSLLNALAVLFKAAGHKEGVTYAVEVF